MVGPDNSIYRATPGTTSFAGPWLNPAETVTRIWALPATGSDHLPIAAHIRL